MEAHFKHRYGVTVDRATKDPSRLCFVSYDPFTYLNPYYAALQSPTADDNTGEVANPPTVTAAPENDATQAATVGTASATTETGIQAVASVLQAALEELQKMMLLGKEKEAKALLRDIGAPAEKALFGTGDVDRWLELEADWDNPPPEPLPLFFVKRRDGIFVPVCTAGNLTCVTAQSKAGKTSWLSAWISAVILATANTRPPLVGGIVLRDPSAPPPSPLLLPDGTPADTLGVFACPNHEGKALLRIDTEQSPSDNHRVLRRAVERAGGGKPPPWVRSVCLTGLTPDEIMRTLPAFLEHYAQKHGGLFAVIVDGGAELVDDPNDSKDSIAAAVEVRRLSIRYDCPIISVIHRNEGDNAGFDARGWLGKQFVRQAESNLTLESHDGITSVWGAKMRNAPIPKTQAPCFTFDTEKMRHVSCQSPAEEKAKTKDAERLQELQELAGEVFKESGSKLTYSELKRFIMDLNLKSESNAKRLVQAMSDAEIIHKVQGLWQLT
jgi:hypothetical protein